MRSSDFAFQHEIERFLFGITGFGLYFAEAPRSEAQFVRVGWLPNARP